MKAEVLYIIIYEAESQLRLNSVITKDKTKVIEGWRFVLAVKSTDCSSRGPEFNS